MMVIYFSVNIVLKNSNKSSLSRHLNHICKKIYTIMITNYLLNKESYDIQLEIDKLNKKLSILKIIKN